MDIEAFVQSMPKVEPQIRLEGSIRKKTLLTIAEQNDISSSVKHFSNWIDLLDHPNFSQIDTLLPMITSWLQHPEDLGRIVYDAGVSLARQNVKYAEICVNTALFMQQGLTLETLMSALNDGRSRAERGWNIRIAWILTVPRAEPRRADETMRWATSAAAKRHGVVGFGVIGPEDAQPIGQFERAFAAAEKKELSTFIQAGHTEGAEGIGKTISEINPHRLLDAFAVLDNAEVTEQLVQRDIPVVLSIARALAEEIIDSNPVRGLYDAGIKLILSSDMPTLTGSSLTDAYLTAIEDGNLNLEELEEVALNAVRYSFLPEDERTAMLQEFRAGYEQLREGEGPLASETG